MILVSFFILFPYCMVDSPYALTSMHMCTKAAAYISYRGMSITNILTTSIMHLPSPTKLNESNMFITSITFLMMCLEGNMQRSHDSTSLHSTPQSFTNGDEEGRYGPPSHLLVHQ